jgi:hypothetical protein
MIVELNTGGTNHLPVPPASRQTAASVASVNAPSAAAAVPASFSIAALRDTLKQSALIRPEKVAQATALVNDGHYPTDADLNRLAGFLSQHL